MYCCELIHRNLLPLLTPSGLLCRLIHSHSFFAAILEEAKGEWLRCVGNEMILRSVGCGTVG